MKNAEWMIKKNMDFRYLEVQYKATYSGDDIHYDYKIVYAVNSLRKTLFEDTATISRAVCIKSLDSYIIKDWLNAEHKDPEILDDEEKKFLGDFLNHCGWRYKKFTVRKIVYYNASHLMFSLVDGSDGFVMPNFYNKKNYYSGMKPNKIYTSKELHIWD